VIGSQDSAQEVEALLEENRVAGYSSVLHFAGHAFENRSAPGDSYLLVAEGVEWRLASMAKTTFASVDQVVLSACSTLDPLAADDSALFGLGGALFAAGVDAVIGTAGPTADEDAAKFAPLLYLRSESSVTSRTAAARFRQAIQRARRNEGSEASPGVWGNWVLVGGLKNE
jgi:CHAT domain-containing protein